MVATSARRAWMIHETGNMVFRILTPTRKTNGMVTMATSASGTLMESM